MALYETSIPGGSVYAGAALNAKTAYQKALVRLNEQRGTTLRNYGFTGTVDPTTGRTTVGGVDPNNMYGAVQQTNREQAQQDEQARWGAQSRGLGTGGGLAAQMRNQVRYGFGAQDAKLGTDLLGSLNSYDDQQTQQENDMNAAIWQAQQLAAQQAQQNEDWSPTDYSGLPTTPYGEDYGPGMVSPNTPVTTGVKAGATKPKPIVKKAVTMAPSKSVTPAKANAIIAAAKKAAAPAAAVGSAASYQAAARPVIKKKK